MERAAVGSGRPNAQSACAQSGFARPFRRFRSRGRADMIRGVPLSCLAAFVGMPVFLAGIAAAQEKRDAEVACQRDAKAGDFVCTIKLKGDAVGHPIQGAAIIVSGQQGRGQRLQPVRAMPAGNDGDYRFRVRLARGGEWTVKIRLAKPRQDLIVRAMMPAQ
ncbi:MAG: hypothetical protein KIT16_17415 [Rhodospirillaceae bacterium]|nr:hypothetical protein [Rhodospirillaceae bacterium]